MKKTGVQPPDEPHIVQTVYDEDGRRIGAVADNCTVKTKEEADELLGGIARLYGEQLRRKAERR